MRRLARLRYRVVIAGATAAAVVAVPLYVGSSSASVPLAATVSGGYLTPGPTGGGIRPGTGQRAATARALGVKAAKLAGKPVKLPVKTVGIINFLNGIESSDRLDDTIRYAAAQIGWKRFEGGCALARR